jgi:hypothetical protein
MLLNLETERTPMYIISRTNILIPSVLPSCLTSLSSCLTPLSCWTRLLSYNESVKTCSFNIKGHNTCMYDYCNKGSKLISPNKIIHYHSTPCAGTNPLYRPLGSVYLSLITLTQQDGTALLSSRCKRP